MDKSERDVKQVKSSRSDEVAGGQPEGTSTLSQSSDTGGKGDKMPQSQTIRQDRIVVKPGANGLDARSGGDGQPTTTPTAGTASTDFVRKRISNGDDDSKQISSSDDDSADAASKQSSKKEKPALRKGKWTVEEEEYTSRVIQHFSAGLLTLPDGATLRSYLANKLNCDPMRITKKFTGACCLGRRVYHLRERPRASPPELEIAKVERDQLEHRFRMRIEHEQSGLPLSQRPELLLAQPQSGVRTLYPIQGIPGSGHLAPWVNNLGALGLPANHALSVALSGAQGLLANTAALPAATLQQQHQRANWLVPGASGGPVTTPAAQPDQSLQLLNNLVTSWAMAQAAVSLAPAALASLSGASANLTQTAPSGISPAIQQPTLSSATSSAAASNQVAMQSPIAFTQKPKDINLPHQQNVQRNKPVSASNSTSTKIVDQQKKLRNVFEEQKKEEEKRQLKAAFDEVRLKDARARGKQGDPKKTDQVLSDSTVPTMSPAEQLQRSYAAHLQSLQEMEVKETSKHSQKKGHQRTNSTASDNKKKGKSSFPEKSPNETNDQPMPDEEAGTVLLGFLNSLRQSYEDAVDEKTIRANGSQNEKYNASRDSASRRTKKKPTSSKGSSKSSIAAGSHKRQLVALESTGGGDSDGEEDRTRDNRPLSTTSPFQTNRQSIRPASVTDTSSGNSSSQPAESSCSTEESSEDSDKEVSTMKQVQSKGPPRKRLKAFTEENVKEHSKRMEECHD